MKRIQKNLVLVFTIFLPLFIIAQTITGIVKDKNGKLLPYINVIEKGTTNSAITDKDGAFSLRISILPTKLNAYAVGYVVKEIAITNTNALTITIEEENLGINEVLSVGSRAKSRTTLDAPVPIDFISSKEFGTSGKITLNQLLAYKSPSYNATNQTHADVTTHYDIADLRGLGSSRMLVLVNGKRKNLSAITHINNTQGKGEVGTDMTSIPIAAIDHVEILRDGASAIYGSDAIAGVINIILKKKTDFTTASVNTGITSKGDGFEIGADINGTFTNKKGAYVNYTLNLQRQEYTDRAGEPKAENIFNPSTIGANQWINENADLGMTIGQPEMSTGNVYFNGAMPFKNGKGELYASIGGAIRKGESFTFYNAPYMVGDPNNLFHNVGETYNGFQPRIITSIIDNMDVFGVKFDAGKFKIDVSGTFGINTVDLKVSNSLNPDILITPTNYDPLDPNSPQPTGPTEFESGAYHFNNTIGNIDISRNFNKLNLAVGAEYKKETFKIIAGELESWFGNGTQFFTGINPDNRLKEDRNSFGAYLNLDADVSDNFLVGAAVRFDNYSDVGSNVSYKANARYKLGDLGVIRASYGTGFRAPALQQMYTNYTQNNSSLLLNTAQRARLNIGDLEAETATNINVGFTLKPIENVVVSIDVYKINVDNRVMLSDDLGFDTNAQTNAVEQLLIDEEVDSMRFFTNALDTETQGVDLNISYKNIRLSKGVLGFNLGVNWNDTKITGEKTQNTLVNQVILNRTNKNRVDLSRPAVKGSLTINYEQERFKVSLNNTLFGPITWQHPTTYTRDQTFSGKTITDIVLGYKLYDWMKINIAVNNVLNVYPDEIDNKGDVMTDTGGRFTYAPQLNQFGFLGMQLRGGVSFQF